MTDSYYYYYYYYEHKRFVVGDQYYLNVQKYCSLAVGL